MNFCERLRELNATRIYTNPASWHADFVRKGACPYCHTQGPLERESDFCYHDRTRLDVSIGYVRVEYGSLWCRFCQHEITGTHVDRKTLTKEPRKRGLGLKRTR